ncbi:MAG: hypothetical protein ACK421_11490, partial [Pseudanabaenaceae cyanobacterium]
MLQAFAKTGVICGFVLLFSSPAVSDVLVSQAIGSRRTDVIRVSTPRAVIDRFASNARVYVQGNPVSTREIDRLQQIAARHPNLFVVLIEYSNNLAQDQTNIARAISNHPSFLAVRNPVTNEREGVLIVVYFSSNEGRKV